MTNKLTFSIKKYNFNTKKTSFYNDISNIFSQNISDKIDNFYIDLEMENEINLDFASNKFKVIITNEIIDGKKLCPKCCKIKDVSHFNKDKYQPNKYDYWCRQCREKVRKKYTETVLKDSYIKDNLSQNISMSFGIKKTRNPSIWININGVNIKGLKCKTCGIKKPLNAFYKLHKTDNDDTEKRKNICIKCMKERRKANKEL